MTQGRKELRSIRLRRETANGTAGTPRFVWRGVGEMPTNELEVVNPEELVGIFGGTDRSYISKYMATAQLGENEATFEQLSDLFLMCGFGTQGAGIAGSVQGLSTAVSHYLTVPTTTAPLTTSYTLEAGDPQVEVEQMTYVLATELQLSFVGGEALMVNANLMGRNSTIANAAGTFSATGTLPPVEVILSSRGSVFLDSIDGAFGAGQVTAGNLLGGQVTFTPTWEPKFVVDSGQLYFHTAVFTGITIEGELTFEHQVSGTWGAAGTAGQKAKWKAEVPQLMRLQWNGGTINNGTTFTNKRLQIDLPIKFSTFKPLDEQNGNSIVVASFFSKYNEIGTTAGRGTVLIVRSGTSEFAGA